MSMKKAYKQAKDSAGMTFLELAKKMGVTQMTIHNRANMSYDDHKIKWLKDLSEATGVSLEQIAEWGE